MSSVFSIQGPDLDASPSSADDREKREKFIGGTCQGPTKTIKNPRTGCSVEICLVGKSDKYRTGWRFVPGSTRCPGRRPSHK